MFGNLSVKVISLATRILSQTAPGAPPSAPSPATVNSPPHPVFNTPGALQMLLLAVYFLVCVGLVASVLMQTTKSEGLSGTIGGSTQSVFRGSKGFEEKMDSITSYLAWAFLGLSFVIALFAFSRK
ncbi:MAG: preprotein translocase subunit SecG [bacterium]